MDKTIQIECPSCKGTGLYKGYAEKDDCAVICANCAAHHDRDVNASINILQEGIKIMNGWNDQDSLLILSSLEDIA